MKIQTIGCASCKAKFDGKLLFRATELATISAVIALGLATLPLAAQSAFGSLKPMAADAKPVFEVVTIKSSSPEAKGKIVAGANGRHILMINTNLNDLVEFAYGIDSKQIVGAPIWSDGSLYDIDGVPDAAGFPNVKQMRQMFQTLLADRFHLTFHYEKRTLSAYAIVVAKGGSKLTKSASAATDPSPYYSGYGRLTVTNNSMADVANVLKFFVERPVVDQTGITGRFDFVLKWAPDESTSHDPNAPPGLFTAIQEQLGLKLVPTKTPLDVIVIDHVERPSAN